MHSFITFDRRGASKYFDNFTTRTEICSYPHDFLGSINECEYSSGVTGDKNIESTWRGIK